jgi:hypothetical protein
VIERPRLVALPGHGDRSRPDVHFCGHCGRPPLQADIQPASRVCTRCGLGLLVSASPDAAPTPQDPFLLVDGQLSICAVSRLAEELLLTSETDVVNSHIGDLLVPADIEIGGPESLVNASCMRPGGRETHHVVLRPAKEFGSASGGIALCGPRAALVVLADGRAQRPSDMPSRRPRAALSCACNEAPRLHHPLPALRKPRQRSIHRTWARSAPTPLRPCSASVPTPCAHGSGVLATPSRAARPAGTGSSTSTRSRRCDRPSRRPTTSPRPSPWRASAAPGRPRRAAQPRALRRGRRRLVSRRASPCARSSTVEEAARVESLDPDGEAPPRVRLRVARATGWLAVAPASPLPPRRRARLDASAVRHGRLHARHSRCACAGAACAP